MKSSKEIHTSGVNKRRVYRPSNLSSNVQKVGTGDLSKILRGIDSKILREHIASVYVPENKELCLSGFDNNSLGLSYIYLNQTDVDVLIDEDGVIF